MNLTNADIKNFKDKKFRREHGIFVVEGDKFCLDLKKYNVEIVYTITTDTSLKNMPNIEVISEKMFNSLSSTRTPQTIICICKIKNHEISAKGNSLILDNLQDPGNVGTLIRSAIAFGFNDIYFVGGADPYSEKVIRSSAGTLLNARLHIVDFEEILTNENNIAENFIVADMSGENLNNFKTPKGKVAIIVGNEGQGVSEEFMNFANIKISIPMAPNVESLNAGVAGSIIMQKLGKV